METSGSKVSVDVEVLPSDMEVLPLRRPVPKVLIVVEGGVVQSVCSNFPIEYIVKDWDEINQGELFDPTAFCKLDQVSGEELDAALTQDLPKETEEEPEIFDGQS